MSLRLLVTGKITVAPRQRISKNGNPYTTALLSVPTDQERASVSVVAFNEQAALLAELDKGDEIAVSGPASLSEWEQDGELRCRLGLVVEQLTTVYKLRQKQKRLQTAQETPGDAPDGRLQDDDLTGI